MKIDDIRDIGTTPIQGDAPAGRDVSYEPAFEALADEIKKLSSPTAEGVINWQHITELGITILRDESKNLVVTCYLNVSLLYTDGMEGFAVGVHILRGLLETWWDSMYPPKKRKKGRINILNWWDDKLRQLLAERKSETWPSDRRNELLEDIEAVDTLLAEKLEDGPMLMPLLNAVSRLLNEEIEEKEIPPDPVVEKEPDPPVDEKEPAAASPVAAEQQASPAPKQPAPQPAPIIPAGEDNDLDAVLRQGLNLLGRAASQLLQADNSQILPYQLNRIVAWSELDTLPPAENGVSMVPPPDEQVISLLDGMLLAENWTDLLPAAESRVPEHLFWLDLSYYSARALKGLGHVLAARAVEDETRLHVLRLTNIESLSFSDKLPFASQKTRAWLVAASVAQKERPQAIPGVAQEQTINDDLEEAARLYAGSGIQAALTWLVERKKNAQSPRREFMYDAGLCNLLLQADQQDMALSFAEEMLTIIDRHRLEKWEPELAVQGLLGVYQCLQQTGDTTEQRKQVMARLALLAPEQMLSLS